MRSLVLLTFLVLLSCASVSSHESNLCPESASLHCMSAPECSMDRNRGCKVCSCTQSNTPYNPVNPDQRLTP
jgi:hypothetical protein